MRVPTELPAAKVPSLVSAFVALAEINEWERRFRWLRTQAKQNPFFLDSYLQEILRGILRKRCQMTKFVDNGYLRS